MIIAIDGPAGAGKSTVAQAVARELGLPFLDTGAMYRALTLVALRRGIDPADGETCGAMARSVELDFNGDGRILIDGEPGEPEIRRRDVTRRVSELSAHPAVRAAVVKRQRALAQGWGGLVAEGRDTTTVVFPEAEHKFFLTATARARARRRARQLGRPEAEDEILGDIERRDRYDSGRTHSPLVQAADAVAVDTTELDASGVVTAIVTRVRAAGTRDGDPAA